MWMYGSGFPKSHNIGKAIDKAAGKEREVVGEYARPDGSAPRKSVEAKAIWGNADGNDQMITAPATPEAQQWEGWGTALKPAYEPIILARKPRGKTYAKCAVEGGAGALWIDGARVGTETVGARSSNSDGVTRRNMAFGMQEFRGNPTQGRWPANVILDEAAARQLDEMSGEVGASGGVNKRGGCQFFMGGDKRQSAIIRPNDKGGASRFFYCAKASRRERSAGLEGLPDHTGAEITGRKPGSAGLEGNREKGYKVNPYAGQRRYNAATQNSHPTVKPIALTEYLARLIRPPEAYLDDAVILIPFAGTGSEIIGAIKAGWRNWLGIEISEEYAEIARARIAYWQEQAEARRRIEQANPPLFVI